MNGPVPNGNNDCQNKGPITIPQVSKYNQKGIERQVGNIFQSYKLILPQCSTQGTKTQQYIDLKSGRKLT